MVADLTSSGPKPDSPTPCAPPVIRSEYEDTCGLIVYKVTIAPCVEVLLMCKYSCQVDMTDDTAMTA